MSKSILRQTIMLISGIIIFGFLVITFIDFYQDKSLYEREIKAITELSNKKIYYEINSAFAKPINLSLAIANDKIIKQHILNENNKSHDENVRDMQTVLKEYRDYFKCDTIFLVSEISHMYYSDKGFNRTYDERIPDNEWYHSLMESDKDYNLNIDNDEVRNDDITLFINCKIKDDNGNAIGVTGFGIKIEHIQNILIEHSNEYKLNSYLIDDKGMIKLSTETTGWENEDFFDTRGYNEVREEILNASGNDKLLVTEYNNSKNYLSVNHLLDTSWLIITENNKSIMEMELISQLISSIIALAIIVFIVILIINNVIKSFNKRINQLNHFHQEEQKVFRKATEHLYQSIFLLNITKNCAADEETQKYFESIGISKDASFDDALKYIAAKHIDSEYQEEYISKFNTKNVLKEYDNLNTNLEYDFLYSEDGESYYWMRIVSYIFQWSEDDCIYMYSYRQNIDSQKQKEQKMRIRAEQDGLTNLYNKVTTEKYINRKISENPTERFAFLILDIDNFKSVNDNYGHSFGDIVIKRFADVLNENFREDDIIGRIGGDEFCVFVKAGSKEWISRKSKEISEKLNINITSGKINYKLSASIGVAVSDADSKSFEDFYKQADIALYETKGLGKNGYTIK